MVYEIYMDSLFLVNFVMNLYLLMMVNRGVRRTATRLRLIGGALAGAFLYCISLILPYVPALLKLIIGTAAASVLMVKLVFRPVDLKACFRLTENLIGYSFLLGSVLLFFMRYVHGGTEKSMGIAALMGAGGLFYLLFTYRMENRQKEKKHFCKVTLICGEQKVSATALVDTGNGLREPVSGKPVSIVESEVLRQLWPEGMPQLYRAIPYHSVGCAHGILKGYEVPEMIVEADGVQSTLYQVYLGAGEQRIASGGGYEMILHPQLMGMD